MVSLLLLLSALSLAAGQNLDGRGRLCPVHVVVNQIVLVQKTPVYVSAHICEETALVVGGTTIQVTDAPTFLETRFEIANTITTTSTITPPGDSNRQPFVPGRPSMGNPPVKPGMIPGVSPSGNEPVKAGSASSPTSNIESPNPSETSTTNKPSNGASASSDISSIVNSPSSSAASSGEFSTSNPIAEPTSTMGSSHLDSATGPLNTGPTSPAESSLTGSTTVPLSSEISTTESSSTTSDPGTPPPTTLLPSSTTSATGPLNTGPTSSAGSSLTGSTTNPLSSEISTTESTSTTSDPGTTLPSSSNPPTTLPPSSTTSMCIVTATPVPECCINELPAGCEALESTNGPDLEPIIPECEAALDPYLTQDMKDCWAGNFTDNSRGTYIADCLEYELELTCITELPTDCKDLGGATGSAVPAGAAKCRDALGPFVHGTSAPCLDEANITDATQGKSIVDCLEVAFGFRSGPVTITDGDICPLTISAS